MWPQEHTDRLPGLVAEGMSASQIARELGSVSRNAVIGKISRLGLRLNGHAGNRLSLRLNGRTDRPLGEPRPRRARPVKRISVIAAHVPEVPIPPAQLAPEPPPPPEPPRAAQPKTLADLDMARDCRWPIGEPHSPDFRYCAAPREYPGDDGAHVYCAHHARVARADTGPRRW
jgi:GcrA cell cycle regulator